MKAKHISYDTLTVVLNQADVESDKRGLGTKSLP